ncbi:hypothetical protein [Actinomadura sp. SCN-SB]
MTDDWISAETEGKEADFRGILAMHATNLANGRPGMTLPDEYPGGV